MSLLLHHSVAEAVALMRGEIAVAIAPQGFPLNGLGVWRFTGIEPAVGTDAADSDHSWCLVTKGWWSLGLTWGLMVNGEHGQVTWNIVLPESASGAVRGVSAHLTGAQLEERGCFSHHIGRLNGLAFQAAMAGHPGTGLSARLENAVRSMAGKDFAVLVLAHPVPQSGIAAELQRLNGEEQFVRDEHLSRPGLEQGSHAAAARYLELIEAARERAQSALQEGGWQVRVLVGAASDADFRELQSLLHAAFGSDGGQPEPLRWQPINQPGGLSFLRSHEAAALSRPPRNDLPGFVVEGRSATRSVSPGFSASGFATTARPNDGPTICVGRILADDGQPREWFEVGRDDLSRHLLIAGMTGSGKTTTAEHLLLEIWREHRIPWLVIEPGLNPSYRRLLNSEIGGDIKVFAVANPECDPLPMNPLAAPVGIGLAEHISGLFAVLTSAFELVPPMPEVLAAAIEETYRSHGWNPAGLVPEGPAPCLNTLIKVLDRQIRTLGYGPEITGNLRAGLLLRLNRLARGPLAAELSSTQPLDLSALVFTPCIIELSALPDANAQALVLGFLALQLRHHWRKSGAYDQLRHVTLIEEAHRLLRAVPDTAANATRARAVEDVANMLAELRGMGAGLIIVDQTPSALVPSVIANTGTKILHRLDHPADRELTGRAAGIPSGEVDLLGSLRVGDAILRSDRRPRPFRLRLPNPAVTYAKLPIPALRRTAGDKTSRAMAATRRCSVCGNENCVAASAGAEPGLVATRLQSLKVELAHGEDVVWTWALKALGRIGTDECGGSAPLCFLIALGRAANLSEAALERLRASFEPRTRQQRK